jgi:hypothetical protein
VGYQTLQMVRVTTASVMTDMSYGFGGLQKVNKAKQHQSLRSLDSLFVARFAHGCAIIAQPIPLQLCR